jgi:hypothetical protein
MDSLGIWSILIGWSKLESRDEKSRHFFGVASGEDDFRGYAEVLRALEWIDDLASH